MFCGGAGAPSQNTVCVWCLGSYRRSMDLIEELSINEKIGRQRTCQITDNVLLTSILFICFELLVRYLQLDPIQTAFPSNLLEKCNVNKFEQHLKLELLSLA